MRISTWMPSFAVAFLPLLFVFGTGCSSSRIIRDGDYRWTENSLRAQNYEKALATFPSKERGGFITSIEKNWLRFWTRAGDVAELRKQASTLENRKFLSVSREAEFFFYQESEDGYVPAEHEIIVLHLLSSMLYMQNGKWAEARVEAVRASSYLQGQLSADQPHFDDPALRLWMAAIWAALGEWNEAQVDVRRVLETTRDRSLENLLALPEPPKKLSLVFSGVGPELKWFPSRSTPEFIENRNNPQELLQELHPGTRFLSFSTFPWYERHQKRNSIIRDSLLKSNYMVQFMGVKASASAERATGKMASGVVKASAVLVGGAIAVGGLYLLAAAPGSDQAAAWVMGSGFLAGKWIWDHGEDLDRTIQARANSEETKDFERLRTYRFVRLLPEWVSLGWGRQSSVPSSATVPLKSPQSKTEVFFLHRL